MEYEVLSQNIKKFRTKRKMTQKKLGEKILKSEISIRKYESGKVNIPPSTLYDICTILGVSSEVLLGSDGEKYHLHNYGEVYNEKNAAMERTLSIAEKATNLAENYKEYGDSWKNAVFKIENYPNHLLDSILNYLENTEEYYSFFSVNLDIPIKDDNDPLLYLTTEQVSDIIKKITELVKYELYKLEKSQK